jgi:type IV pilus assembly protein PilN
MKLSINLASQRHMNQGLVQLGFVVLLILLVVLLTFQGVSYLKGYRLSQIYQSHLDELQLQLQGKQPERVDPQAIAERQLSYDQARRLLMRDSFRWTALFDRMEALLPAGVSLLSFNPDYEKKSLQVNGLAKDLKSLQALLDSLENEKFEPVYLNGQGQTNVDDGRGKKRVALTFTISLGRIF